MMSTEKKFSVVGFLNASHAPHRRIRLLFDLLFAILFGLPFLKYSILEIRDYVGVDWHIFYDASKDIVAGNSPYPEAVLNQTEGAVTQRAWGDYLYPPFFARVIVPFTWASKPVSAKVFLFLNLLVYFGLFLPWRKKGGEKGGDWGTWSSAWLCAIFLLGWGPSIVNFRLGQSNILPLLLLWCAWKLLSEPALQTKKGSDRRREMAAGALLGVAAAVKMTSFLMLPILVATLRLRLAVAMGVGFLVTLVLSGPVDSYVYFTKVIPTLTVLDPYNVPFMASAYCGLPVAGILFAALLTYLFVMRNRLSRADPIPIGCFAIPIFSGVWIHHYMLTVLPVALACRLFVRDIQDCAGPCGGKILRLLLFMAVLLPGFSYWAPVKGAFVVLDGFSPQVGAVIVILGNSVAFLLLLERMTSLHGRGDNRNNLDYHPSP